MPSSTIRTASPVACATKCPETSSFGIVAQTRGGKTWLRYVLHINGRDYVTSQNKPLLRYLRDDLHLERQDGCSEVRAAPPPSWSTTGP